jgi:hypothetical protein
MREPRTIRIRETGPLGLEVKLAPTTFSSLVYEETVKPNIMAHVTFYDRREGTEGIHELLTKVTLLNDKTWQVQGAYEVVHNTLMNQRLLYVAMMTVERMNKESIYIHTVNGKRLE